jgi:hypothetical protein
MSKDYNCKYCCYVTKDKRNYFKHCKTKRHANNKTRMGHLHRKSTDNWSLEKDISIDKKDNSEKPVALLCDYCNTRYGRVDSLKRHQKRCSHKQLTEKSSIIEQKDKTINQKDDEIHYLRQILKLSEENNGAISKFKYVNSTYLNTKPLKTLTYEEFNKRNKIQYINDSDNSENSNDTNNKLSIDDTFIKDLLYYHRKSQSATYIGKTLVKIHINKDPEKIQFWTTDCSRLKFIVRTKSKQKSSQWEADVNGKLLRKKIINPILKKTIDLIDEYYARHCIPDAKKEYNNNERVIMMREQEDLISIKEDIELKRLHKRVLQYIAPIFAVKKAKK